MRLTWWGLIPGLYDINNKIRNGFELSLGWTQLPEITDTDKSLLFIPRVNAEFEVTE